MMCVDVVCECIVLFVVFVVDWIVIECVELLVDGGCFVIKCVIGELFVVSVLIFMDGYVYLVVVFQWCGDGDDIWCEVLFEVELNDCWYVCVMFDQFGCYEFCVVVWCDDWVLFVIDIVKKCVVGQDVMLEVCEV